MIAGRPPGVILPGVDDLRFGAAVRAVRVRRRLRQADVATLAGVSAATVGRVERGAVAGVTLGSVRSIASACGIRVELQPRWRGGELDRLLSARHSAMHDAVSRWLRQFGGWELVPEASYAIGAERGVIDVLGWHPAREAILVLELKTQIVDVNDLLGAMDRRKRLAPRIAADRGWWRPTSGQAGFLEARNHDGSRHPGSLPAIAVWVLVAEGATNRRRVAGHADVLRRAFPADGRALAGWLRDPSHSVAGLSFFSDRHWMNASAIRTPVHRVRRRRGEPD